jgi:chromate reductase
VTKPGSLPTLLCLSGSLRRHSFSTAVMTTIIEKLDGRVSAERFDLTSLPYYNADFDTEEPLEPVKALKDAIASADGVVIVTPEYNYSVPGVLKNAIDWASRPGYNSVFKDKPVIIVTVSAGAMGGVRCQAHLKNILAGVLAKTFVWQEIAVSNAGQKIENGHLTDEATIEFTMGAFDAFLSSL